MKKTIPIVKYALTFMKITLLQVLLAVGLSGFTIASPEASYGQGVLDNTLSISVENKKLGDILSRIEKLVHVKFSYNPKTIPVNQKVSVDLRDAKLKDVLGNLLEPLRISYEVSGDYVILSKPLTTGSADLNDSLNKMRMDIYALLVSGTVTSTTGESMPGVNIIEKGTTNGTTTDVDGKYSLVVSEGEVVLVFSFIGYTTQEVAVNGRSVIDVILAEDVQRLEEVIVVGYGEQKKVNVTGSIANMSSAEIAGKSVSQASLALAGEMSGISVRQLSGNPGKDQATIRIRGFGTFSSAGNNPLVIIDGIESSLDDLNPNDIKSISVLKDAASASIYGSRAANGVILVETKKGAEGKIKISYNTYFAKQKATSLVQFVDSWTFAEAMNEALTNMGADRRFTEEDIQKFKSGEDPVNYPNKFHYKDLFSSGSGFQNRHDINFSGGTSETQYFFSAGYLRQEGLVQNNFYDRYDIRLNLNSKIGDNINLKVNLSGNVDQSKEPSGRETLDYMVTAAMRIPNYIAGALPNGYYGNVETHHPEADLASASFAQNKGNFMFSNVALSWNIFKDLKMTGAMGYTEDKSDFKRFRAKYVVSPTIIVEPNRLTTSRANSTILTLQSLIEYDKSFKDHSIHVLGGYSQQEFNSNSIGAYRDNFPNNELYEINAASPTNMTNSGSASRNKLRSYFGRGNYSYKDKYLLEANVRYDGSSRFPKENRYGLFPSFSAGWRISEEAFFQNIRSGINDLKIRGSWGELGNQSIGNYPYQEIIYLNQNYPFGGSLAAGAASTNLPNKNITWETTRMTDVGLDVSLVQNKINLSADYFVKKTFDILYNVSASTVLGATPSVENAGTVENRGWDFNLIYKDNFQTFSYNVSANFSVVNNEVLELANVDYDIARGLFVGESLNSFYGYDTDGLFVDANDVQEYPSQPYNAKPGTIRLKDISGPEGVPDGIVTAAYDRKVLGSSTPKYMYGLRMNTKYKDWDLSILFQGEGGMKRLMGGYEFALGGQSNIQKWQWEQRWTKENPDPNAAYPILENGYPDYMPGGILTYWLHNASFLRLKNVQIGYTLPSALLEKFSMSMLRIYISGQNILTFDHYKEGWDPEMEVNTGNSAHYPPTAVFSAGINIAF